jgi:hypothetical protein
METLDNSAIYRHKKLLGTIYQNKLARQVVSDSKASMYTYINK